MIKETKQYLCDICKKETDSKGLYLERKIPMSCTCSQEDGARTNKFIIFETVDICHECMEKIAVVKYGYRKVEGL